MGNKIFLNGEFVEKQDAKISIFDHGLLYGDGVFEGIRSYNRKVFKLKEHIDRLYESAKAISLNIGIRKEDFIENIKKTLQLNDLDNAYLRVVVTRGVGDLGLDPRKCNNNSTIFIITDKITLYPKDFYENGLFISIAKTRRNHPLSLNPNIKSLNYLNNILGKIEAIEAGTPEALMLTIDGYVAECTGDNIFIIKDNKLVTPLFELGALKGITQQTVIDLAKEENIEIEYAKLLPKDIFEAQECFLTGTAAEIIPVVKVDENIIGEGIPGIITKKLLEKFKALTLIDGEQY